MPQLVSQRTCTLTFRIDEASQLFTFPRLLPAAGSTPTLKRQRYADGDLVPADPSVHLRAAGSPSWHQWAWAGGAGLLIASLALAYRRFRRRRGAQMAGRAITRPLPESITPFAATTFLRTLRDDVRHDATSPVTGDLDRAIAELEGRYYGAGHDESPAPTPDELRALLFRLATEAKRTAPSRTVVTAENVSP